MQKSMEIDKLKSNEKDLLFELQKVNFQSEDQSRNQEYLTLLMKNQR